jgi:hypothetical protein
MSSFGMIFDRRGILLDEIDAAFQRSWKRNLVEQCTWTFPVSHRKCTRRNFRTGNYIVVFHDNGLPDWGGRMELPNGWGGSTLTITANSAEYQFSIRAGVPYAAPIQLLTTAGAIYRRLINAANAEEDTLLRPGEIYEGGRICAIVISASVLLEKNIAQLLKRTGQDYSMTPYVTNNRLVFLANWHERIGRSVDISLNDSNSEMRQDTLKEEGPIYNSIFGYSEGSVGTLGHFYLARDANSIAEYGLHHKPLAVSTTEKEVVQLAAEEELKRLAWPRRTFAATARNQLTLNRNLRVGNILLYENAEAGFGTEAHVGIEGLAYKDGEDNAAMVLKEIL